VRRAGVLLAILCCGAAAAAARGPGDPGPASAAAPAASPAAAPESRGPVRIEVGADRTSMTIGDPVALTVTIQADPGVRLGAFLPEKALGALTVLGRSAAPPRQGPGGVLEQVYGLRVASYAVGPVEIPGFEIGYVDAAGKQGKASSAPLHLEVVSVLPAGETQPADIKPPARMPEPRLWPYVAALLALVAAALWFLRRRLARRPAAVPAAPPAPPRPPEEVAFEELARLLSSGLLEAGRIKELHIELAEIVRRYLAARFGVETFERTSSEILEALRGARAPIKACATASEFFAACDLVKFAKHRPGAEETRATVGLAYRLVDETRPAAAATAPAQPAAAAAGGAGR
jgi:hypothetical protein